MSNPKFKIDDRIRDTYTNIIYLVYDIISSDYVIQRLPKGSKYYFDVGIIDDDCVLLTPIELELLDL